jgi:hypothetical protein
LKAPLYSLENSFIVDEVFEDCARVWKKRQDSQCTLSDNTHFHHEQFLTAHNLTVNILRLGHNSLYICAL